MHLAAHMLWTFLLLLFLRTAQPCIHHLAPFDPTDTIAANNPARQYPIAAAPRKIALHNVRVFDGRRILPPSTVIIDRDVIGTDARGARHINGKNQILLPGFIDAHCHPNTVDDLRQMSSYGITTAFVQSVTPLTHRDSLKSHDGLTDLRFSSHPAAVAKDMSQVPFAKENYVDSPDAARAFIANQTWSDWIKILVLTGDYPHITQPILNALIEASRLTGKFTVVHATAYGSVRQALLASASQIHHSPVDSAVDDALVRLYLNGGQLNCPTLTAMKAIAEANPSAGYNYSAAAASVTALYRAQVPILAGTDAHSSPAIPFKVAFGSPMHSELQLLVNAGMSALDALRAATVLPARYYGLKDRGSVEAGKRADLVLVGCDPIMDISCSKDIRRIWIAGVEHEVVRR